MQMKQSGINKIYYYRINYLPTGAIILFKGIEFDGQWYSDRKRLTVHPQRICLWLVDIGCTIPYGNARYLSWKFSFIGTFTITTIVCTLSNCLITTKVDNGSKLTTKLPLLPNYPLTVYLLQVTPDAETFLFII